MKQQDIGFGTIPWWIWNSYMKYDEMERQLRLMKEAGLEGWTLWARYGLEGMEYLSHEFMQRFQFAVEKSAELGLDVWVFDEYAWPTCSAKGQAEEVDPEYRLRVLSCFDLDVEGPQHVTFHPDWGGSGFVNLDAVPREKVSQFRHVQEHPTISPYINPELSEEGNRRVFNPRIERVLAAPRRDGRVVVEEAVQVSGAIADLTVEWDAPEGHWRLMTLVSRDYGMQVDVLNPDAVRCFINLTHEKYKRHVGKHFGTTFKGFFSDETRMVRATQYRFTERTTTWSKNLFERLEERGIGSLDACLAAVFAPQEDDEVRPRRLEFWRKITDIYSESFYQQICAWAEDEGLIYTGDCFSEDGFVASMGDYFKMVRAYHLPGLDALGLPGLENEYHFKGPKFPSSVAHQNTGLGAGRCLTEGPGLLGWGATMEHLRRVTDWMYVFGVNLMIPNAFHSTVWHEQLYETPSYFFQWTLWPFYPDWDCYVKNLGRLLTRGMHVAPVAIFYPTETTLACYRPIRPAEGEAIYAEGELSSFWDALLGVPHNLLLRQIDFDYLDSVAVNDADIGDGTLQLGGEEFSAVVVLCHIVIERGAVDKLKAFAAAGGHIVWVKPLPLQYDDGASAADLVAWIEANPETCSIVEWDGDGAADRLKEALADRIELPVRLISEMGLRFCVNLRRDGSDELLFIVYFDEKPTAATLEVPGWPAAEAVDVPTGQVCPCEGADGRFELTFAPYESKMLRKTLSTAAPRPYRGSEGSATRAPLTLDSGWEVTLLDDNLVVAEPVEVETEWGERRAWEATLKYRYRLRLSVAERLNRVFWLLDDSQIHTHWGRAKAFVNGREIKIVPSPIIDHQIPAADLGRLEVGENEVTLELEHTDYASARDLFQKRRNPAPVIRPRVLGRFVVRDGTLYAMPDRFTADTGEDLTSRGLALYSGRAVYTKTFSVEQPCELVAVEFADLADHVVVRLDDREIGRVLWRPWRLDCGTSLSRGEHRMEVEVVNTQANQMFEEPKPLGLLGPVTLHLTKE